MASYHPRRDYPRHSPPTFPGTFDRRLSSPPDRRFHRNAINFLTTYRFIRGLAAPTVRSLLAVGLMWVGLTIIFELSLGILVFDYSWQRLSEDYDISRGGLMGFGLLFMILDPLLAAKARDLPSVGRTQR